MQVKAIQLHKKAVEIFEKTEDSFDVNPSNYTLAIADGATQGYYSGMWARALTKEFVRQPVFNRDQFTGRFLADCLNDYDQQLARLPATQDRVMNILAKEKKKEGAYSTFMGIQLCPRNLCKVISCGDCNLFLVPFAGPSGNISGDRPLCAFPHRSLIELNNENNFLNTRKVEEMKMDDLTLQYREIQLASGDEAYLLTDAMSRYVFKYTDQLPDLGSIQSFDEFLRFAEQQWQEGSLEQDDLTMVKLRLDSNNGLAVTKLQPPPGFSFNNGARSMPSPSSKGAAPAAKDPSSEITELQSRIAALEQKLHGLVTAKPLLAQLPKESRGILLTIAFVLALFAILGIFLLFSTTKALRSNLMSIAQKSDSTSQLYTDLQRRLTHFPPAVVIHDTLVQKKTVTDTAHRVAVHLEKPTPASQAPSQRKPALNQAKPILTQKPPMPIPAPQPSEDTSKQTKTIDSLQ